MSMDYENTQRQTLMIGAAGRKHCHEPATWQKIKRKRISLQ